MGEFMDRRGFDVPDGGSVADRVRTNVDYYRSNYLVVVLSVVGILAYSQPAFGFVLVASVVAWFALAAARPDDTNAPWLLAAVSFSAIFYFGGDYLVRYIAIGVVLCAVHAVFRSRSVKSSATHAANTVRDRISNMLTR